MKSPSRRTTRAILEWTFKPDQSIDHVHAFPFQGLGPLDIAFFVEAGLQFQQYRNLLAFFDAFEQGLDNGRVSPHAIERHLDREHVRIARGAADEFHHRLKGFKRMVQQNIFAAGSARRYPLWSWVEAPAECGGERLVFEIGAIERAELPQPAQIQRALDQINVASARLQAGSVRIWRMARGLRVSACNRTTARNLRRQTASSMVSSKSSLSSS